MHTVLYELEMQYTKVLQLPLYRCNKSPLIKRNNVHGSLMKRHIASGVTGDLSHGGKT